MLISDSVLHQRLQLPELWSVGATAPLHLGESQAPSTSKLNSPILPLNWLLQSLCFMAGRDPAADNSLFLPHLSHSIRCQSPTLLPPTSLWPCVPPFPLPPPLLDSCGSFLVSLLATSPAGYLFQPTLQRHPRALRIKHGPQQLCQASGYLSGLQFSESFNSQRCWKHVWKA